MQPAPGHLAPGRQPGRGWGGVELPSPRTDAGPLLGERRLRPLGPLPFSWARGAAGRRAGKAGGGGGPPPAGKRWCLGSPTAAPRSRLGAAPGAWPPCAPACCKERPRSARSYLGPGIGPVLLSFCFANTKTRPAPRAPSSRDSRAAGERGRCDSRGLAWDSPGCVPGIRAPPQPVPWGTGRARPGEFSRLLSVAACRNKKPNSKHLLRAWLVLGARRVRL